MVDVEVLGAAPPAGAPSLAQTRSLCALAARARGIEDGHVAVEYVSSKRIAALNATHRGKPEPTDVLSFPIDGDEQPTAGAPGEAPPRELGDIVICAEHTADLREAIVHAMLHLLGMDHETDDGEMLALQSRLLAAGEEP